jgi:hypothetical protein
VPFDHWLDMQAVIRAQAQWQRTAPDVTSFTLPFAAMPRQPSLTVTICRTQVHQQSHQHPAAQGISEGE